MKLLFERVCICFQVPYKPIPVNFLQLSNFPEASFQSHITTPEESETKSLAVVLGDGKAEFQTERGAEWAQHQGH